MCHVCNIISFNLKHIDEEKKSRKNKRGNSKETNQNFVIFDFCTFLCGLCKFLNGEKNTLISHFHYLKITKEIEIS